MKDTRHESLQVLKQKKIMAKNIQKKPHSTSNFKTKSSVNPFEVHINHSKYKILGQKSKDDRGLPGISRAKAFKKREKTLLHEYRDRHKSSKFMDKRIGENNPHLDPERKMMLRLVAEKKKQFSKNSYVLNDNEELFHGGKPLDEAAMKDRHIFSDEDDDDDLLDASFVKDQHFGGDIFTKPESSGAKNRKEWLDEMIAESKKKKAETRLEKQIHHDDVSKLDAQFQSFMSSMKGHLMTEEDKEKSKKTCDYRDFDTMVRRIMFDRTQRAQPADRLKSAEEIAKEENQRLQKLEEERQRRMLGHVDTASKYQRSADALDDGWVLDVREPAIDEGKYNEIKSTIKSKSRAKKIADKDIQHLDENEENEVDSSYSSETSEDEEDDENEEEVENETESDAEKEVGEEYNEVVAVEEEASEEEDEIAVEEREASNEEKNVVERGEEGQEEENDEEDEVSFTGEEDAKEDEVMESNDDVDEEEEFEDKMEDDVAITKDEEEFGSDQEERNNEEIIRKQLKQNRTKKDEKELSESHPDQFELKCNKQKASENKEEELPFTFEVPVEYDEFWELLENKTPDQVSTVIERMIACNHPSLGADNKTKTDTIFTYILQTLHSICCVNPDLLSKDASSLSYINSMIPHLYTLTQLNPNDSAGALTEVIDEKYEEYTATPRRYPYIDTFIFLKVSGLLFPASDFHHDVMTRVITFLTQLLKEAKVESGRDIVSLLFTASLLTEYLKRCRRFVGELMNALNGILYLAIPKQEISENLPLNPPFRRYGPSAELLVLSENCKKCDDLPRLTLSLINEEINISNSYKSLFLREALSNICRLCSIWTNLPSARAVFYPTQILLEKLPVKYYSNSVISVLETLKGALLELPKQIPHLKKDETVVKTLKMLEPSIEEVFDGVKKRGGSKDNQETQKLLYKLKRERKGAKRELKRDSQFLARQQLKEVLESDAERKRKVNLIMQGLAAQESEYKKFKSKK